MIVYNILDRSACFYLFISTYDDIQIISLLAELSNHVNGRLKQKRFGLSVLVYYACPKYS